MTGKQIEELGRLHRKVIAQAWTVEQREPIVLAPENAAFLVACNNSVSRLLEERKRLLAALRDAKEALRFAHGQYTCAEGVAVDAIAFAEEAAR